MQAEPYATDVVNKEWALTCCLCHEPVEPPSTERTRDNTVVFSGCDRHFAHAVCCTRGIKDLVSCPYCRAAGGPRAVSIETSLALWRVGCVPACECQQRHTTRDEYDTCAAQTLPCETCHERHAHDEPHVDVAECPYKCGTRLTARNIDHVDTCDQRPWTCKHCSTTMTTTEQQVHGACCKATVACRLCAQLENCVPNVVWAASHKKHKVAIGCPLRKVLAWAQRNPEKVQELLLPESDDGLYPPAYP